MTWCDHVYAATPLLPVCTKCGRTPSASPSGVETWAGCRRKHAYRRSRPRKQNRFAAAGDVGHKFAENWLRDGTPPDATDPIGRVMIGGLHLLPMPRAPGLVVEHKVQANLLGVMWSMRIDYLHGFVQNQLVCVGDHKTTRSISDFAKDADELAAHPQGIAYPHWAAETFDVPFVVCQWTYYQRDGKAPPRPVVFVVSRDEARDRFTRMHVEHVLPMVRSFAHPPEDFPRDGIDNGFCYAFGECEHIAECHANLTPDERQRLALVQLRRAAAPRKDAA